MSDVITTITSLPIFGTIVNALAIIVGGIIGLCMKKGMPRRIADSIMKGVSLVVLYIGISGSLKGENTLILVLSIVIGCIIGELLKLDDKLTAFGNMLEEKFRRKDKETDEVGFAEGFIYASLLFCVGAMAILGALQSGLEGNHTTLYTKALLDGISSIVFTSMMGVGVIASAACVFVYQGAITMLAQLIAPFLSDSAIAEMTCVGSVLIVALALNMLKVTDIKVMNYVPAVIIPIFLCMFM